MGLRFYNTDGSEGTWSGTLIPQSSGIEFYTDFSEYSTGVSPSDWSPRWDASSLTYTVISTTESDFGGQVLRYNPQASNPQRGLSWDQLDIPNNKNVEIEMRTMPLNINSGNESDLRSMIRGSGFGGADNRTLYNHGARLNEGGIVRAARIVNNSFTSLPGDRSASIPQLVNTWYMQRIRQEGPNYYIKVWLDSDPEPQNWSISDVDPSELDQDGWIGISGIAYGAHYVDYFKATIFQ